METARNAARQGGAWGGDVARELEYRLAVVTVWYITWPTAKNWHTTPTTPAGPGSQIQLLLREDNLVDFQSSPHPCTSTQRNRNECKYRARRRRWYVN